MSWITKLITGAVIYYLISLVLTVASFKKTRLFEYYWKHYKTDFLLYVVWFFIPATIYLGILDLIAYFKYGRRRE